MGHPAAAARHRGRQPAAARAVPGGGEPGRPGVEQRVDHRRVPRVLDGAAAVALDEGQHHVLAAQPGQQLVGRGAAERVVRRLRGEHALVAQARGHLAGLLVGERGRAAGGDRHGGDELRAEGEAGHPGHRQDGDGPGRGGPVPAGDPGDPQHGQRRRDDHDDDQHDGGDRRTDRARGAERALDELPGVAEQDPVEHRVEGAPEHGQEAHVEHLEDRQQPRAAPPTAAAACRIRGGSTSRSATPRSSSTGMRTSAAGVSWSTSRGGRARGRRSGTRPR